MKRTPSSGRIPLNSRTRQKDLKLPLHCIFLVLAALLSLWMLWMPLSAISLERLAVDNGASLTERGIDPLDGNPSSSSSSSPDSAASGASPGPDLKAMSDLDVAKHSKAEAEAIQAALDAQDFRRPPADTQQHCDEHFGSAWLEAWNASQATVCSPHQYHQQDLPRCVVRCRSQVDRHMPNASAPHVICDATNLTVDPSKMYRASCPKHRPNYMCSRPTYNRYKAGAFGVVCDWPMFRLEEFPLDHLRDVFEAMTTYGEQDTPPKPAAVDSVPALLVTRESQEYNNVFHAFTDLLNAYITATMLGWGPGSPRQVVMLDNHPQGPLDPLWAAVAAGGGPLAASEPWKATAEGGRRLLRRVSDLRSPTLLSHAAFVPPGYTSLLFAFLYEDNECPGRTSLFRGFREHMLTGLGLGPAPHTSINTTDPLRVLLVSRKPYAGHRRVARQMGNEEDVLAALGALPGVVVEAVDLGGMHVTQQIDKIARTDVLIGMHGAALVYSLLQPPYAALVELWPQANGIWRCYEHTAEWSGLLYRRWANAEPSRVRSTRSGDITQVDVDAVADMVADLLPRVRRRRAEYAKNGDPVSSHQPFLVR